MTKIKNDYEEIPQKLKIKTEKRDKKGRPKMKISGKRVFQLKKILKK